MESLANELLVYSELHWWNMGKKRFLLKEN